MTPDPNDELREERVGAHKPEIAEPHPQGGGSPADRAVKTTSQALADARLGTPQHYDNLTIIPLYLDDEHEPDYDLLGDAISQGTVEVTEVSVGGSVPELSVVNRGGRPVLIPEGAILSGAKQNRVVNVTVLVAPESTYTLPVSCVERGRWGMKTSKRAMADAGYAPPSLRFSALEGVNTSRSLGLGARSDQVRVWTEVSHISAAADADSPTDSLSDVLDAAEGGRRRYREAITLPDGACGFVAGLGGDVIGVELFGYASVMSAVSPTLIDGYFAHAAWSPAEPEPTALEDAQAFIEQVSAGLHAVDGVGDLGVEMAVDGPGVVGQALVYADRLCRLAAIRHQEDD